MAYPVSAPIGLPPNFYDRNPTSFSIQFGANYAPHVETQRDAYTVPAGRILYWHTAFVQVQDTAAANQARSKCAIDYGTIGTWRSIVWLWSGTVKVLSETVHHGAFLLPGDTIALFSENTGVANYDIYGYAHFMEFDL